MCKECGGAGICEHGRERSRCKDCGGGSICEHGRRRSTCKQCGGGGLCEHRRVRSVCKECGGGSICEHGRQRGQCKQCGGGGGQLIILDAIAVEELDEEEGVGQNTSGSATAQGHVPDGEVKKEGPANSREEQKMQQYMRQFEQMAEKETRKKKRQALRKEREASDPCKWPAEATLTTKESPPEVEPEVPACAVWSDTEEVASGTQGPRSKRQRARRS